MRTPSPNLDRLQVVAAGFGELLSQIVFVGGAVIELYVEDPSAPPIRNTEDVDCVIPVFKRSEMHEWDERLRRRGFRHDVSQGAPICRWLFDGVPVDVMPPADRVLGFTNRWYRPGMKHAIRKPLPNGLEIQVFALPWFLAAKMVAVRSRGWPDLRMSHDFEDIVYLWDCVPDLAEQIARAPKDLGSWIREELAAWRAAAGSLREAVECVLPPDSPRRAEKVYREMVEPPWG